MGYENGCVGKKILMAKGEECEDEMWSNYWDSRFDERRGMKNCESGVCVCVCVLGLKA